MERKTELYSGVYDFALIKTVDSIKLDHMIQPICLPFDTGYFYQILTQLLFNALTLKKLPLNQHIFLMVTKKVIFLEQRFGQTVVSTKK